MQKQRPSVQVKHKQNNGEKNSNPTNSTINKAKKTTRNSKIEEKTEILIPKLKREEEHNNNITCETSGV